jgi:cytochrome c oxidase assembly protein subunit 11
MNRAAANRTILIKLLVVTVGMFGFGYTRVDQSRLVTLEFDANIRSDLPWQFRPLQTSIKVHPGQMVQVMYEVHNRSDQALAGQAIPSYGPQVAGQYFRKLDCFCFSTQTFAPREVRQMPVVFVIEPGLPRDVNTVTLSYTFFKVEGAAPNAARPRGGRSAAG